MTSAPRKRHDSSFVSLVVGVWSGGSSRCELCKHQWSSGRIHRCHRCDPGSIPGWCICSLVACDVHPRLDVVTAVGSFARGLLLTSVVV